MSTHAFESNRTYEPSARRVGYLVRTMTALTLSPLLTSELGSAFFTEQTTSWPTPTERRVYLPRPVDPPSTPITEGGIVLALYKREKTGKGTKVSSSLMANGAWANACMISSMLAGCPPFEGVRRENPPNALINQYPTRDGRWILLIVITPDKDWARFAAAIERQDLLDDGRFRDQKSRNQHAQALAQELERTFAARDFAEWKKILDDAQITFSVVGRTDETPHDPQMLANDIFVGIDHDEHGRSDVVNSPIWLRGETKREATRAPRLGEHTDEVLGELGYDAAQIETLRKTGALGS